MADGKIVIDTAIDVNGVRKGLKQVINDVKKSASEVQGASQKTQSAINKQVTTFEKQAIAVQKQNLQVEKLEQKLRDLANNPIKTEEFKQLEKDVIAAERAATRLNDRINEIQESGGKVSKKLLLQQKNANDDATRLAGYRDTAIKNGDAYDDIATQQARVDLINQVQLARDNLNITTQQLAGTYDSITAKVNEYTKAVDDAKQEEQEEAEITQQARTNKEMLANTWQRFKETITGQHLKDIFGSSDDYEGPIYSVQNLEQASKRTTNSLKSMGLALANSVKSSLLNKIKQIGKNFLNVGKNIESTNKKLRRMAFLIIGVRSTFAALRKLRSAIVDGFNNFAQYSNSFNASMSAMKSEFAELKNNLASALAPAVSTLVNMLTSLLSVLNNVTEALAKFWATATGKGFYTRAKKQTIDYAKSVKSAGSATEGSLASFDKLNVLTQNKGSGGSGEKKGADAFEQVKIDNPMDTDSWGQSFSNFLDMLNTEGIPKLKTSLENAAKSINEWAKKVYDMFTFPGVVDKVYELGKGIAEAFNNFIDLVDWEQLGATLGAGINLALSLMLGFVQNFDFVALGKSIASFLNGAIEEINWHDLGQLITEGIGGVFEALAGFIVELDWKEVANAIIEFLTGAVDGVNKSLDDIPWDELYEAVRDTLTEIFTGLPNEQKSLNDLANSIVEFISKAIGISAGLVARGIVDLVMLPHHIIEQIVIGIEESRAEQEEAGGNIVEGILEGINEGFSKIGEWIKEHIFDPFMEGFKKAFGIHSPSTVMHEQGGFIVDGMLNGILDGLATLHEWIKEHIFDPFLGFFKEHFGIDGEESSVMHEQGNFLMEGLKTGVNEIIPSIVEKFENLKKKITDVWEGVRSSTSTKWQAIKSIIKKHVNYILEFINKMISGVVSGMNTLIGYLNNFRVDVPEWVTAATGITTFGFSIPTLTAPQIPYLATGAVLPANQPFLAMLGDQKNGKNLEAPEGLIRQIMREELGNRSNNVTINASGDMAQLIKLIKFELDNENSRVGTDFLVRI